MIFLFSATTWTLIVVILSLLFIYGMWPYSYFKKLGIDGPRPLPFAGTILHAIYKGFLRFDGQCQTNYGNIWGVFEGRRPMLMVADPEMIKAILVKECYTTFTNRRELATDLVGPLADGITALKDEKWKRIRSSLSPCFTSGRLKQIFPIVECYADRLIGSLKKRNLDESIDIKAFMGPYSLDVVTSSSFSVDTDSINNPDDPPIVHLKRILNMRLWPIFVLMAFPFARCLFKLLDLQLMDKDSVKYFYNIIKQFKGQHHADKPSRVDFLQIMMQSELSEADVKKEQPSKGMTDPEILSQAFIFIFGGYDTTSTTLSFILYNLAINPDALRTLHEEIDSTLPGDTAVSYEALMNMPYLEQVMCESMRLLPTAPRLERTCKKTIHLNGITIPEGLLVGIPVMLLHTDPQYWKDPELFRPERFSKDNSEEVNPYVYLPFGLGPRNCIGMRFAVMTMKMVLVRLLQRHTLETCRDTPIPLEFTAMFRPKQPIKLKFAPRK